MSDDANAVSTATIQCDAVGKQDTSTRPVEAVTRARFRRSGSRPKRVGAAILLVTLGCQKQPHPERHEVQAELSRAQAASSAAPSATTTPAVVPPSAQGKWVGTGSAVLEKIELPGNQGVQLAWLKDDGTAHAGPVRLTVLLAPHGAAEGLLEGALGELRLAGVWQDGGSFPMEVRGEREGTESFRGTLRLALGSGDQAGRATLRAVSGDGRFIRSATFEVHSAR